jgi:hypothetical protein
VSVLFGNFGKYFPNKRSFVDLNLCTANLLQLVVIILNQRINVLKINALNVVKCIPNILPLEDSITSFYLVTNTRGIQIMNSKDS